MEGAARDHRHARPDAQPAHVDERITTVAVVPATRVPAVCTASTAAVARAARGGRQREESAQVCAAHAQSHLEGRRRGERRDGRGWQRCAARAARARQHRAVADEGDEARGGQRRAERGLELGGGHVRQAAVRVERSELRKGARAD